MLCPFIVCLNVGRKHGSNEIGMISQRLQGEIGWENLLNLSRRQPYVHLPDSLVYDMLQKHAMAATPPEGCSEGSQQGCRSCVISLVQPNSNRLSASCP